jgi:hypothetical protein
MAFPQFYSRQIAPADLRISVAWARAPNIVEFELESRRRLFGTEPAKVLNLLAGTPDWTVFLVQKFVELQAAPLMKEGKKPVQISESPSWQVPKKAPNTLYEGQYRRAEREGECPRTQVAVVVDGRKAGTVMHVCTDEKCKIHRQFSHYEISPQERAQRRKLALAIRVQKETRSRILKAVREKLPAALARADFEMVALDYFRRLGHDNHHRLFQIYG